MAPKREVTKEDAAEADTELKQFFAAKVSGEDAEDLSQRSLLTALDTFDRASPETTFTGWALGCGQKVLLRFRSQAAKSEIATGLLDESAAAASLSGGPQSVRPPAGFDRRPHGPLVRGYDPIDDVIRGAADPVVHFDRTDIEAIEGVASLVLGLLHQRQIPGEGDPSEYSVHEKSTTASHLAKIHAAYVAAFGYPAKDERWVLFAHHLQVAIERVMLDEHDGRRELIPFAVRVELGELPAWVQTWLTDEVLTDLLAQSTLTRGGRGKKGSTIAKTVPAFINTVRAKLQLAPLPTEALILFSPSKGLKKKTRPPRER